MRTQMNEIEFHKKQLEYCTAIIEGLLSQNKLYELYIGMDFLGNLQFIEKMLEISKENEFLIQTFSNLYGDSEEFLLARGLDPYGAMTKQELKRFKKMYPDPYRLRVPGWVRIPVMNFIRSLKCKKHGQQKKKYTRDQFEPESN